MSFPSRHRVRLWFGPHQLADYIGEPAAAARHEAAMRRRFPGLKVTNEQLRPTFDGFTHRVAGSPPVLRAANPQQDG